MYLEPERKCRTLSPSNSLRIKLYVTAVSGSCSLISASASLIVLILANLFVMFVASNLILQNKILEFGISPFFFL